MSGISRVLLPVVLVSGLLAGCSNEATSYSPNLAFDSSLGSSSGIGRTVDMTPYPPPGSDYYGDNWYESGSAPDNGRFSNW